MDDMGGREIGAKALSTRSRSAIDPIDDLKPRQSRQDIARAGREIVDDQNLVALRQVVLDQVRAEAAGAAGNQDPHEFCSTRRCV